MITHSHNFKDISGVRFGSLIGVRFLGKNKHRQSVWEFLCDCGNYYVGKAFPVRGGRILTCKECSRRRTIDARTTHGEGSTKKGQRIPEYTTWTLMLYRCRNKNCPTWNMYGGRGIKVCKRWHKYENFVSDMGRKPTPRHTLDRINVNGNYEPSNCRWATPLEQANNTRFNKLLTINGETMSISMWARNLGIPASRLHVRIMRGWPLNKIVFAPKNMKLKTALKIIK